MSKKAEEIVKITVIAEIAESVEDIELETKFDKLHLELNQRPIRKSNKSKNHRKFLCNNPLKEYESLLLYTYSLLLDRGKTNSEIMKQVSYSFARKVFYHRVEVPTAQEILAEYSKILGC